MQKPITSIFWPTDLLKPKPLDNLVVVGYKVDEKVVVIDFVQYSKFRKLNLKSNKPNLCLEIIGTVNFHHMNYRMFKFDTKFGKPVMEQNENLILFKPPLSRKLEYYSIKHIAVNIFWTEPVLDTIPDPENTCTRLCLHFDSRPKLTNLKEVIKFINLTEYSRYKLLHSGSNSRPLYSKLLGSLLNWIGSVVLATYQTTIVPLCGLLIFILNYPLWQHSDPERTITLSSSSFLFHQLNFRLKQFQYLPCQFLKLRNSMLETEDLIIKGTKFSPGAYIKLYNTLWLILNDLLLGIITSTLLSKYHDQLHIGINSTIIGFESFLVNLIHWLMNSPAGFKLNNELAEFFGELIMWVLDFWNEFVLQYFTRNSSTVLKLVTVLTRFGGFNLLIATILDCLSIVTFHLHCFYFSSTRVFNWQSHILRSLFRLFYGKKYNILRNRIDSNNYEFDQLLFGIIIFTLLVYLLPTVVAFYLSFVSGRIVGMLITTALEFVLVTLNHLPIVALLLKAKHKERLPGGIVFEYESNGSDAFCFKLMARPLSLKEIFNSHIKSMLNFNLINLQESQGYRTKLGLADVLDQWGRVSPIKIARKIVLGEVFGSFDYKKLF
ncbi:hypothetical protein OGAPHI_000111 [Ogataea philodendri]|uniref:Uncharacterized protein n=1 Tax=Ogataea philodendri TaxID=1378263 RepID=A0A9P8PHV6_9ASCO|nr:uncharacterized protein OGAPHI_000111 [Ogataea philodendri]KAH3671925.1 hypothetical protein OGAPHI_000111 [Ogataea philodendri]